MANIRIRYTELAKATYSHLSDSLKNGEFDIDEKTWDELSLHMQGVKSGWFQYNDITEFLGFDIHTQTLVRLTNTLGKAMFEKVITKPWLHRFLKKEKGHPPEDCWYGTATFGVEQSLEQLITESAWNSGRTKVSKAKLQEMKGQIVEVNINKDETEIERFQEYDVVYRAKGKRPYHFTTFGTFLIPCSESLKQ